MKNATLKILVFSLVALVAMNVLNDAVAQILAARCIGGPPTVTRPAPDTLLITGTACMDTINLDAILAATPPPAILNVKVTMLGQNDTFNSAGHPGIKLVVSGGTGNDSIMVGGVGANTFAHVDLFGDAGNDRIAIAENTGQAVGGSGADQLDSGDTAVLGPIPAHALTSGTLAGPADGSADVINCFDGAPGAPFVITDDPMEGDFRVGC